MNLRYKNLKLFIFWIKNLNKGGASGRNPLSPGEKAEFLFLFTTQNLAEMG